MKTTILDGGMGQELMARSGAEPTPLWATQTMMDAPELVEAIHKDYFDAGADIATTNSYAIHRDRLAPFDVEHQFNALHQQACEIANRARDKHGSGLIAGAAGPTGGSYRPDLSLSVEQGAEVYSEIARLQAPHVDFFLLETISSIQQAQGASMGAKSAGKPVWLAVTVDDGDGTKLRSGEPLNDILQVVEDHNVDALLINCSVPEAVSQALSNLGKPLVPIGAYANGFTHISDAFKQSAPTVASLESRTDLDPNTYLNFAKDWHHDNASIIGGCCEVGPAHIKLLSEHFK